jgi:hypothetical protein
MARLATEFDEFPVRLYLVPLDPLEPIQVPANPIPATCMMELQIILGPASHAFAAQSFNQGRAACSVELAALFTVQGHRLTM